MTGELGHFALILALCLAAVQAVVPLAGSYTGNRTWMAVGPSTAIGQFVFLALAFAALMHGFLTDDFSLRYVAENGNTRLPVMYKISAVWGAHEGSLLLWVFLLSGWGMAVALLSRHLPQVMQARVLSVLGMAAIGFLLFMLLTSNPFERLYPAPAEGRSLNPLLQDPGLAIHPPLLYMGYVGFSVAFAFALAALLGGKLDAAWARWSRPWTTTAWIFLTLGITLGSWWAYNELGWGGWWFWDPVENASFMPWLVGTALIHSLAVTEKRGAFKTWTVLLAIAAFSMSLLGTFLVRSGVLTSVHAFATDPARGVFILIFLSVVVGGSLAIYAWRAPHIRGGGRFELVSRETFLLANNVLLVVIAAFILLGTLFPLIYDALGWGKISVGFPWFNKMFVSFAPFLLFVMGIGPLARWKHHEPVDLVRKLRLAFGVSLVVAVAFSLPVYRGASPLIGLGIGLAAWLMLTLGLTVRDRLKHRKGAMAVLRDFGTQGRSFYGMVLAHLGVAITLVGITLVSNLEAERDVRMAPGKTYELAGYGFRFDGVRSVEGPNYVAARGTITVFEGDRQIAVLHPEKRNYGPGTMPMTESGVDVGLTRDLYASLGEDLGGGEWAVRLYYKPYVRWIWLGGLFMALGGLLAISDRRYRVRVGRRASARMTGGEALAGGG
ncbi:MAG TPA: heme lyase CcmF/NrfE family subunit [Chromatiales bacterium]|nr:heme lyase CcmF/NrfE family subunit [Chromatiales bacterium]